MTDTLRRILPCLSAPAARAASAKGPPPPPPEATSARSGRAAADACQVSFGGHSEAGTCAAFPDGTLASRPAHPPPHDAPPEAVQACAGVAPGETCAVTLGGNTLDGTCDRGPGSAGELACRPAQMPPPPGE